MIRAPSRNKSPPLLLTVIAVPAVVVSEAPSIRSGEYAVLPTITWFDNRLDRWAGVRLSTWVMLARALLVGAKQVTLGVLSTLSFSPAC